MERARVECANGSSSNGIRTKVLDSEVSRQQLGKTSGILTTRKFIGRLMLRRLTRRRGEVLLASIAVGLTVIELVRAVMTRPNFDTRERWLPIAEALQNGATLYLGPARDNKPPVWELLNFLVGLTDHYLLVMYGLFAVINGALVIVVVRYARRQGLSDRGALLAGVGVVVALQPLAGASINVRTPALLLFVGALIATKPILRGVLAALAGLICQQVILAIPVMLYVDWREGAASIRRSALFIAAGLTTAVLSFLPVWGIWGPDAVEAGIRLSFLSTGDYVTAWSPLSPWVDVLTWGNALIKRLTLTLPIWIGLAGWLAGYRNAVNLTAGVVAVVAVFAASVGLQALPYWFLPAAVFGSLLAADALETWL